MNWPININVFFFFTVGILVPLLVAIVRLGVHLPTILRGFIFYVQISPIAVEFLPQNFSLRVDVVSTIVIIEHIWYRVMWLYITRENFNTDVLHR